MKMFQKSAIAAVGAAAIFVSASVGALACTSLSTLTPGAPQGDPGAAQSIVGHAFDTAGGLVSLHWNSMQGPVIARARPDASGNFRTTFTVPKSAQRGSYVIIATQTDKKGQPAFGTPARISFQVGKLLVPLPHGATAIAAPAAAAAAAATPSVLSGYFSPAIMSLSLLGIALFLLGASLFMTELRRTTGNMAPAR